MTVDACKVIVWIDVVPGKVVTLPGAVVTRVLPGKVVTEPGSVLSMIEAGSVETLVEVTVTDVKLPEMLVVDSTVSVKVVLLTGTVLMMVLPGRETVEAGIVTVRVVPGSVEIRVDPGRVTVWVDPGIVESRVVPGSVTV